MRPHRLSSPRKRVSSVPQPLPSSPTPRSTGSSAFADYDSGADGATVSSSRSFQTRFRASRRLAKLTWAKADPASSSGPAGQPHGFRGSRIQNMKTTPCKVAWQSLACAIPRRQFDTSGTQILCRVSSTDATAGENSTRRAKQLTTPPEKIPRLRGYLASRCIRPVPASAITKQSVSSTRPRWKSMELFH